VQIKRARIQNFRCLQDVEIAFDLVTTFIGPNGVGKSTVLRALDWFFNGGVLTEDDVLSGAGRRWIQVEVEFGDLTETDRAALGKYAPGTRDTVTVWRTWEGGADKMTGKALAFGPFEEIRSVQGAAARKGMYNELRAARPGLGLPAWTNAGAAEGVMSGWEHEHPDQLHESEVSGTHFFGFAGQGLMSGLFDYVLVTADLRASEEAQDSKTSLLGRILERTVDRAAADSELQELSARFLQEQDAIRGEHLGPQLEEVSRRLSDAVAAFTPGRSVKISTVNTDPRPHRVQFSVSILDHLTETRVDRQGHGFQRALLIAALKLLADHGAAAGQQGVICLAIEEPELFQHPVQARAFASVLRRLAEDERQQIQVTYATHSPFFLEAAHFPQVRRVSREAGSGGAPPVSLLRVTPEQLTRRLDGFIGPVDVQRRMGSLCIEKLPEALFAEAVVLVEGTTEQAIIEGSAERDGTPLAIDGVVVVAVGGKGGFLLPHAILTLLGIPCYVIFDGDKGIGERMRRNARPDADPAKLEADILAVVDKSRGDNREILRFLGETQDDWPATSVSATYAVFEVDLEAQLRETWPAWTQAHQDLVTSGAGFPGKHGPTYRQATIDAREKAPDVFQEILTAGRALRYGA
jgi:predicted ATP-dependent endonuclease of OLD family